jgi:hypothetical protein
VATGVYTPGVTEGSAFNIPPGVAVYGGFAGDETSREERDWETHVTVLSGDIGGDDITDAHGVVTNWTNIVGDNNYHVVWMNGTSGSIITGSTVLDGFSITGGQAYGSASPDLAGGGLICYGSGTGKTCSPTLTNVSFNGNASKSMGGAMCNFGTLGGASSPTLINVSFSGNHAPDGGGAMYNTGSLSGASSPTLINVTFHGNSTGNRGGAMYNNGSSGASSPTFTNTILFGNTASDGPQIYNSSATCVLNTSLVQGAVPPPLHLLELLHEGCEPLLGEGVRHHSHEHLVGHRDGMGATDNHIDHLLHVLDGGTDDHCVLDAPCVVERAHLADGLNPIGAGHARPADEGADEGRARQPGHQCLGGVEDQGGVGAHAFRHKGLDRRQAQRIGDYLDGQPGIHSVDLLGVGDDLVGGASHGLEGDGAVEERSDLVEHLAVCLPALGDLVGIGGDAVSTSPVDTAALIWSISAQSR